MPAQRGGRPCSIAVITRRCAVGMLECRIGDAFAEHQPLHGDRATRSAMLDYIQHGRPATSDRHLFFRVVAPVTPVTFNVVVCLAAQHLRAAGVCLPRMGSHTLRHTCVQGLVDAGMSLKMIGDYVGHRHASSTQIHSKVDVETLRAVACGDGEEVL
jgi:integrase/recombinase XerD